MKVAEIADAWITMWGWAYVACAFLKPDIVCGLPPLIGHVTLLAAGLLMLGGLFLTALCHKRAGAIVLYIMGILETWAGVASWAGFIVWNVPSKAAEPFSVSMAVLDLLGAVFLIWKAHEALGS